MTLKHSCFLLALVAGAVSCSDSSTQNDNASSESQVGVSSASVPVSNPVELSSLGLSSGSIIPLSSMGISSGVMSSVVMSSTGGISSVISSSTTVIVPSSSSAVVDGNNYEKLTEANAQHGWGSRYWDACKPHCSIRENIDTTANPFSICRNCDVNGDEIASFTLSPNVNQWWTGYEGTKSACLGGPAYACMDMAPIAINDSLAYAYGATSKSNAQCGQCFQIQFDGGGHNGTKKAHGLIKGKTLIIMASNTGSDVDAGQFDIMIPGGGVGIYDALSTQIGVASSALGAQYGGFLTACQQQDLGGQYDLDPEKYKTCVRSRCEAAFGGNAKLSNLLRGCNWFVDWLQAADNPTYLVKPVTCPAYLTGKYKSTINTTKDTKIPASKY